ncbi:MAG: SMI1/KNR4 family protein [Verrucomicrobium sp.]
MNIEYAFAGKALTEEEINAFEERHRVSLPEDYRHFLLSSNGGMPSTAVLHLRSGYRVALCQLYSLNDDFPYDLDRKCKSTDWATAYRRGCLRIGRDPGGSGIFISTRGDDRGSIYFFDREEAIRPPEGAIKLADSFTQFMAELEPY